MNIKYFKTLFRLCSYFECQSRCMVPPLHIEVVKSSVETIQWLQCKPESQPHSYSGWVHLALVYLVENTTATVHLEVYFSPYSEKGVQQLQCRSHL